jgi:hypothetical protein
VEKPQGKRLLGRAKCSGRIILKCILEKEFGMDRIHLPKDRDQYRALANTVMNIRVP